MKTFLFICCFSLSSFAGPLKLALNWKAEPQFGGFYTGDIAGIYKKNKLDVLVLEGGSGTPTIQMLASGKVDYAVVSADEIILAHDRGAKDIVALFASYQTNPQGIMTHEARGFKNIQDVLKGDGLLLWQAGLPYAQFMSKKFAPLKVKAAPYSGGIANFQNDPKVSQQCFVTSEPMAAAKAGLKVKTFLVAEGGYNPYTTVLATTASRLKAQPEEVKAMVKAVRESWGAYLKDPSSTNQAMLKINKAMDAETFKKSAEAQTALISTKETDKFGLGSMTLQRWTELRDQLLELKLIKTSVDPQTLFQNF